MWMESSRLETFRSLFLNQTIIEAIVLFTSDRSFHESHSKPKV